MHAVHAGELLADQRFLGGAIHLADAQARQQLAGAGGEQRGGGRLQNGLAMRVAAAGIVLRSRDRGSGRAADVGAMLAAMAVAVIVVAGVGIVPVAVVMARVRIVPTAVILARRRRMVVAAAGVIARLLNARDGDLRRRVSASAAGAVVLVRLMFVFFDRR
ncbi:hypothetical protein [Achromobacter insolitus]|uniref:hypothetical protein n=1 Tax=Achromobacter insolitus TaxID=217204 RepID=UPI001CD6D04E|nr:hypothetical protein [Achromobacter insolitus]